MNARNVALLLLGLVIGLLAAVSLRPEPLHAQARDDQKVTPGRYQMTTHRIEPGGLARLEVVVLDTATGQCWRTDDRDKNIWRDLGSPVKAR